MGLRRANLLAVRTSEKAISQNQEEVGLWGRGRAGRILRRLADARADGVCRRGGFLDARPRGLRHPGHLDAQAAGRRVIATADEIGLPPNFSRPRLVFQPHEHDGTRLNYPPSVALAVHVS